MDFSKTTVFVVPASNTLPSSGGPQDLVAKKFGVFLNTYAVANAGNIAAAPYFYLAQGQPISIPGQFSKRSDKIHINNVIDWYKVTAETDILPQITEVSNFKVQCGEYLSLTIRFHSNYIDNGFFNGMTKSVTVKAPCCECGEAPCTDLDPEATVDAIIVKAKENYWLNKYFTFERQSSGSTSVLRIIAKALESYSNSCDISAFPHQFDRFWFHTFVYPSTDTTQDFFVNDSCETGATVLVKQRATYLRGTSGEIKQLETNFYSYLAKYKHLFTLSGYNPEHSSNVVDGTFYDTYVIKLREHGVQNAYQDIVPEDFTVIIAVPTGEGSTLETVLVAGLGAVTDQSASARTTTTTTSTTSTSTTSTTLLFP
jgi:hypothetical protein